MFHQFGTTTNEDIILETRNVQKLQKKEKNFRKCHKEHMKFLTHHHKERRFSPQDKMT